MAVTFCGGERTAEGLPCPLVEKKEGEEDTKTFPLPPSFCLAEKATFCLSVPLLGPLTHSVSPREGPLWGRKDEECQTMEVIYYLHGSAGKRPTQAWEASVGSKA